MDDFGPKLNVYSFWNFNEGISNLKFKFWLKIYWDSSRPIFSIPDMPVRKTSKFPRTESMDSLGVNINLENMDSLGVNINLV